MAKNRRKQIADQTAARKGAQPNAGTTRNTKATGLRTTPHNPFEMQWSRQKHKVAGRDKVQSTSKTTAGKPVKSRAQAIEFRRNTLLAEYKKRNRKSNFQDKRIGERDATMTLEDKMLERFAHQHKKNSRGGNATRFHLADDEGEDRNAEDMVPSWSRQITTDDFPTDDRKEAFDIDTIWDAQKNAGGSMRNASNPFDADDDELENKLGEQYVSRQHFGGGLLQRRDEDSLTHDQRINELIADSKREKYEKQKAKDEVIGLTEEADKEWRALLQDGFNVLTMYERRPKRETSIAPPVHKSEDGENGSAEDQEVADDDDNDYDAAYKMLQISEKSTTTVDETSSLAATEQLEVADPRPKQHSAIIDLKDDSANAKTEQKNLSRRLAAASTKISNAQISVLKSFPESFRAFKSNFNAITVESRVATLNDLLIMYHPSLDELNNKRVERLFSYVMLYILTSNDYATFEFLRDIGPLIVRLWNFTVTKSLPQIAKFLAKIDADTDGSAPHSGHLAFLHLLATLIGDGAMEFSRHESDRERRSEQYASHDMLWKSTMLIVEKLIRKSARGRCAAFKCLFAISIATDMLESRQLQQNKVVYSTALVTALERLAKLAVTLLQKDSIQDGGEDADSLPVSENVMQELFLRNSAWSFSASVRCSMMTVQLTKRLMQLWHSLEAFEIIFSPTIEAVKTIRAAVVAAGENDENQLFKSNSDDLLREYAALKPATLTRLHFLRQKPKPLPMLEPKLDMDEKSKSEKKQREKRRALQNAVRKEMKGAKKEIRKDNQFLAHQQLVEQMKLDEQRKRKLKELMSGLQSQEHEAKVMEKQKRRWSFQKATRHHQKYSP